MFAQSTDGLALLPTADIPALAATSRAARQTRGNALPNLRGRSCGSHHNRPSSDAIFVPPSEPATKDPAPGPFVAELTRRRWSSWHHAISTRSSSAALSDSAQ